MTSAIQLPDTCTNFYELLGLKPFESDARAVDAKVRERMREARKYQVGQFAEQAQKHLDLLAEASACLLDAGRKEVYDEQLRQQYNFPPVSVASTFVDGSLVSPQPLPAMQKSLVQKSELQTESAESARRRRGRLLGGFAAAIVVGIGGYAVSRYEPSPMVALTPAVSRPTTTAANRSSEVPTLPAEGPFPTGFPALDSPAGDRTGSAGAPGTDPPDSPREVLDETAEEKEGDDEAGRVVPSDGKKSSSQPTAPSQPSPKTEKPVGGLTKATAAARPIAEPALTKVAEEFDDLHLTPADVLRELKLLRLNRPANSKLPPDIVTPGWQRAERLVRYGLSAHRADKRFIIQLKQEVVAQKRVHPQLRNSLRDIVN